MSKTLIALLEKDKIYFKIYTGDCRRDIEKSVDLKSGIIFEGHTDNYDHFNEIIKGEIT